MARRTSDKTFRVVLVGEPNTGKSALLERLCHDTFNRSYRATVGADFERYHTHVDGSPTTLVVWDTGIDRSQSVFAAYYHNASAALIVFDVSNPASFQRVRHWYAEIQQYAPAEVLVVLVAAKTDLERVVSASEAQSLAKSLSVPLVEVCAKSADRVKELFETVAKKCVEKSKQQQAESVEKLSNSSAPNTVLLQPSRKKNNYVDCCTCTIV